jgi:predicted dehydrogenase/nucleoside-diphosphate-sugar epimerase
MSDTTLESYVARANGSSSPAHGGRDLRIGLVGAGKMAQHHARAVGRMGIAARVVAFADPSPAAAEQMRAVAPSAVSFPSLDRMLEDERLDVVHVCTPPATHENMAAAALGAGCHIYVEKPFVPTSDAAERLLALAASRGLQLCAGHQLLFEEPARRALELLPALGTLAHVESFFSFRTVRRSPDGRTPLRADLQLLDILPHPVYLLLRVLEEAVPGEPSELRSVEVGPAGTVHALVKRGQLTGTLTVTLEGRPVDSFLRIVGSNGAVHADFVRGTVQRQIGPGSSGIDKLLNPYREARQLTLGTTAALGKRFLRRQRSYPGLAEIFDAFYSSIREGTPPPMTGENILDTVRVCERVADALAAPPMRAPLHTWADSSAPRIAVTGGTGFLGAEVVRQLSERGTAVRVLARREPPEWERVHGAEYVVADLSQPLDASVLAGIETVIHCAAATSGGWEEHQAHSLDATEHTLQAAHAAGTRRFLHVSSLAVLEDGRRGEPVSERSSLKADSRTSGPYVWGKLESERIARELGAELGLEVRVARPGAIIDGRNFDPPGKLGRRVGNIFVAVGSPRDTMGVVDVEFAARTLVWMAANFDTAPDSLNILSPQLPTKRSLLQQLRRSNPDLRVVWLPRPILHPLSWAALGAQKVLRPGRPATNVASVFGRQSFDTAAVARLAGEILGTTRRAVEREEPAPAAAR